MVKLDAEQTLRMKPAKGKRVICLSGVVWLTQAGDHRDTILSSGEFFDVGRGVTVITALEPTWLSIETVLTPSGVHERQPMLHSILQWMQPRRLLAWRNDILGSVAGVPYY